MAKAFDGLILVDKAPEATSFQVVRAIKKIYDTPKVGHTGTLDPIATGLLPMCVGRATKLASIIMTYRKEYDVWVRFGLATDSHDRTGVTTDEKPWEHITEAQVRQAMGKFMGEIPQIAPMFSAVKYKGRPLYWYAHKGIMLANRKERTCHIDHFDLLEWQPPRARFLVRCSHGTYVRTLVHDLAAMLGSAAIVDELRRTACGDFRVEQAFTLAQLQGMTPEERMQRVLSMNAALPEMPNCTVGPQVIQRLQNGRTVMWSDLKLDRASAANAAEGFFKLTTADGDLVAVASWNGPAVIANRVLKPLRIFTHQPQTREFGRG